MGIDAMSDHAAPRQDWSKASGAISPVWVLIGIIMIVALYTTIHGLYALTGNYLYAIPFGLVAQSILLIVSLNIARGRASELKTLAALRARRMLFLATVYLLFFSICWFFAFSTYYNIFLARGDDVQTTASQVVQLGDLVLPGLRQRIDDHVTAAAKNLHDGELVTGFNKKIEDLLDAAGRPETASIIANAAFKAAQDAFNTRQSQRKQWLTEEAALEPQLTELKSTVEKRNTELNNLNSDLAGLPKRIEDLHTAIEVEFPPGKPAAQLSPDGLASKLVSDEACRISRDTGRGSCLAALASALQQAETRLKTLPQEVARKKSELESLRAQVEALPKQQEQLKQLLKNNPPLPAPVPRGATAGAASGPDLTPLSNARKAFADKPTESNFTAVRDACLPIQTAMRALNPAPQMLSGLNCRAEAVLAAITVQQRLAGQQQAFLDKCGSTSVTNQTTDIINRMRDDFTSRQETLRSDDAARRERLGQAVDEVRREVIDPCLEFAPQFEVSVGDLNRAARAFEDEISPRQTEFSLAYNAAIQVFRLRASPPAYLGAVFAAGQELAILLLSLLRHINIGARAGAEVQPPSSTVSRPVVDWSTDPSDPPVIAAIKIILGSPDARGDGSLYLPAAFGRDEKPEIQANIQQLLRMLKREGKTKRVFFRRGTRLTSDGVQSLERQVEDYAASQSTKKDSSVAASPAAPPAAAASTTVSAQTQGAGAHTETAVGTGEPRLTPVKDQDSAEVRTGRRIGTRA
jgi:hypothetical protein